MSERWDGPDRGLIWSWERGRQKRREDPDAAERAQGGELVPLPWKVGSFHYLAMWQGMRNESLSIDTDQEISLRCTKRNKTIRFPTDMVKS